MPQQNVSVTVIDFEKDDRVLLEDRREGE